MMKCACTDQNTINVQSKKVGKKSQIKEKYYKVFPQTDKNICQNVLVLCNLELEYDST